MKIVKGSTKKDKQLLNKLGQWKCLELVRQEEEV